VYMHAGLCSASDRARRSRYMWMLARMIPHFVSRQCGMLVACLGKFCCQQGVLEHWAVLLICRGSTHTL
jgi:hypothetical protein